ncbi:MAG: hypothetical protein KatS3mg102_1789 [Planctomycetota bacterium]|nr:MAG: hypothetical protein KatS3mg102_1789 [Planctomycetota bacterium]
MARARRELAARGRRSLWLELQHALLDRLVFAKVRARLGGRLRFTISGGAALSREVAEFISDVGIQVYEGYGLTETSPIVSTNRPGAVRIGTVGKPIPGVEVLILDEEQRPLPQGEDGEICVIGPNIMQGYHNRPEATAEVIFEYEGRRCFRTGDMGHLDPDGFLVITGRIKEQYKLENGKYVVPAPLEEKLKLSGLINQAFIYGDNKPYNVALVVPDEEAVRKWARQRGLPGADGPFAELIQRPEVHARIGEELQRFAQDFKGYERPQRWALIAEEFSTDNDLLTPTLKIKRRNIIKRYQELIERLYSEEPARAA